MRFKKSSYLIRQAIFTALGVSGIALLPGMALAQTDSAQTADQVIHVKKVVETVTPEKAVATVSKTKVKHTSPSENLLSILKNVPGFNVLSSGPGNLLATDTAFTLNGFTSAEVGTTFDGVPIINTFLGGVYGQGDDHAITPLTTGQISDVQVYSGANTPQQNSIDSLGGTINFTPKLPSDKSGVDVSLSGGAYAQHGNALSESVEANSGALASLNNLKVLARFEHTNTNGFQKYTYAHINSYYLAAVQPFGQGMSQLSLIVSHNTEKARFPELIPLPILSLEGRDYQYPADVATNWVKTQATHAILGLKSLLNPMTIGVVKVFYNATRNDRTAYANPIYNNSYMGYSLPTSLKSDAALNGYGNNFNTYNDAAAIAMFGSAHAGTQYQRYIDNYHNIGTKAHLSLLLPHNTLTLGGMLMQGQDFSAEGWYGSQPVPIQMGYNMAWLEHDTRNYWDTYIQDNMSLAGGKVHVYPGIKHVNVALNSTDAEAYYYFYGGTTGKTFSYNEPSLGVTFSPIKPVELYANVGRTYKAPNISSIYSKIGNNPTPDPITIRPEYVDSVDAGVRYSSTLGKVSLAVFHRHFNDIFAYYYDHNTGITTEYNAGEAVYKGVTLAFEKPLGGDFLLQGNVGYTDAKYTKNYLIGKHKSDEVTSGMARPNVPKYTGNLGVDYQHGHWFGGLGAHFVGPQYLAYDTGVTSTTKLPAYVTLNAKVSYTWKLHGAIKALKLTAHIDNLLDKHYVVYGQIHTGGTPYELAQEGAPRFIGLTVTGSF